MSNTRARMSHYVLPSRSAYESWDTSYLQFTFPEFYLQMRRPVIEPEGEPFELSEFWTRLADEMGFIPPIPENLYEAAYKSRMEYAQALFSSVQANPKLMRAMPFVVAKTLGKAMGSINLAWLWAVLQVASGEVRDNAVRAGFKPGPNLSDDIFQAIVDHPEGLWSADSNMGWKENYKRKLVSAEEAAKHVKSGDITLSALGLGEPSMLIPTAIAARKDELKNVTLGSALQFRPYPWYYEGVDDSFIVTPGFASALLRNHFREKRADFIPLMTSTAGPLITRGVWKVDVALLMVTPPHHGWCNLGLSNFYSKEMVKSANIVIAEVNDQLPTVYGDNWVHVDDQKT